MPIRGQAPAQFPGEEKTKSWGSKPKAEGAASMGGEEKLGGGGRQGERGSNPGSSDFNYAGCDAKHPRPAL